MKISPQNKSKFNKCIYLFIDDFNSFVYTPFCIELLKKHAPQGYEIKILTIENIEAYTKSIINPQNFKKFQKVLGTDIYNYIAVLVLYFHGGLFLSPNVITTKNFNIPDMFLELFEIVLYANGAKQFCDGYILGNKSSKILKEILEKYKKILENPSALTSINPFKQILCELNNEKIMILDSEKNGYIAEKSVFGVVGEYICQKYYFSDVCSVEEFFATTKGITYIEDKFVPQDIRNMPLDIFLNQDFLLTKILGELIEQ